MIAKDIMKTGFVSIGKDEPISKLIGKFQTSKSHNAVVLDGKKYAGIVCKRKMLSKQMRISDEKVKNLIIKPAVLDGSEELDKVAALMNSSDVHMLPIVKSGAVKGVVYAIDLLKELVPMFGDKRVSDVSKGKCISFDQHTEISKAMKLMRYNKIGMAPIVNSNNKIMGIISIVDLVLKFEMFPGKREGGKNLKKMLYSAGKDKEAGSVYAIHEATVDVVTASRDDRLKKVVGLMSKNKIADVVIVDSSYQPVGIVTLKDILKLF